MTVTNTEESNGEMEPQDSGHLLDAKGGTPIARWATLAAMALYVAVGIFPYSVSGLLVPPLAVATLMTSWALGLVALVRWGRHSPAVAAVAVAAAVAFWFLFVSAGSVLFGWTA